MFIYQGMTSPPPPNTLENIRNECEHLLSKIYTGFNGGWAVHIVHSKNQVHIVDSSTIVKLSFIGDTDTIRVVGYSKTFQGNYYGIALLGVFAGYQAACEAGVGHFLKEKISDVWLDEI
jgi:hypothetical protein